MTGSDSVGEGNSYPLQYSGLENSICIVHGIPNSQTRLSDFHFLTACVNKVMPGESQDNSRVGAGQAR